MKKRYTYIAKPFTPFVIRRATINNNSLLTGRNIKTGRMTTLTKVNTYYRLSFLITIYTFLFALLQIVDAKDLEKDNDNLLTDLEKDNDILLTDIDESEGRFFNVTLAPYVVVLGALATALLISIPLALALIMGSGGGDDTKGGDAGYGSSSNSGYGGEYRYFYNNRKRRSPGIDVKINSKCITC